MDLREWALSLVLRESKMREEAARQRLLHRVRKELDEFPRFVGNEREEEFIWEGDDLPTYGKWPLKPVRLFPIGEYKWVWFEHLRGHTVLYLGEDGKLYEYGPKYTRSEEAAVSNPIRVRPLELDQLEVHELDFCLGLLRRVWLL